MASFPKEHVVKVRAELDNGVMVRPGDKLVVCRSDTFSMADGARLKEAIASKLPGVEVVIIGQCSGLAVYRDEPDSIIMVQEKLSAEKLDRIRAELAETLPGE